jgi:hypothetical protein
MTNLRSSLNYLFGKLSEKYYSLSLAIRILLVYLIISVPFLYFHEKHLPSWITLVLILFSLGLSFLMGLASIWLLRFLFKEDFRVWVEVPFFASAVVILYFLGLLDNRAGWTFLFFCLAIFLAHRLFKVVVIYRIFFLGTLILLNGLFTFRALQAGEWILFHWDQKLSSQNTGTINPEKWEWDEKSRILRHDNIPIALKLPDEMFFHKPKGSLEENRGTGSLILGISNSPGDANVYPYIRLFFLPSIVRPDILLIAEEFANYLSFEVNRGDIEALQSIGEREEDKKKWKGRFWIFYDNLRPRNAKTGFYILPLSEGNVLVLEIRENLNENTFHENYIQEILDTIEQ